MWLKRSSLTRRRQRRSFSRPGGLRLQQHWTDNCVCVPTKLPCLRRNIALPLLFRSSLFELFLCRPGTSSLEVSANRIICSVCICMDSLPGFDLSIHIYTHRCHLLPSSFFQCRTRRHCKVDFALSCCSKKRKSSTPLI